METAVEKEIRYYREMVYGNELIYPVDYKEELQTLTGQKTLNTRIIGALGKMGYRFREVLKSEGRI